MGPLLAAALPSLISGGFNLLGGLFNNSDEEKMALEREKMAQDKELSLKSLAQQQADADQKAKFAGFGMLANQVADARQLARQYDFKNALYKAAVTSRKNNPTATAPIQGA